MPSMLLCHVDADVLVKLIQRHLLCIQFSERRMCGCLSFNRYVTEVFHNCHFHIRALRHIRPLLTNDAAICIANSIVSCYCKSPLNTVLNLVSYSAYRILWHVLQLPFNLLIHPVLLASGSHYIGYQLFY